MERLLEDFGWPARAAAAGAVAALGLIVMTGLGPGRPPGALALAIIVMLAVAALVALSRVAMPAPVRAALMLALVATTLVAALRADVALVDRAAFDRAPARSRIAAGEDSDEGAVGERQRARSAGGSGARLTLDGRDGAGGWASGAQAALDGRIAASAGGAGDWRIDGDVRPLGSSAIAIEWRIAGAAAERRCGRLSVTAGSAALAYLALGDTLAIAVRRSIRAGAPTCA